ncbi:CLEC16A-like protein [Babesia caballi]|uniref:CLEC16A-like protein n=1 Tax=Babesia caballi TaxID=5871 RepID=A0AAV4LUC9_BABCB|nr:CLEC16A-like protein [Babesia caballi]
MDGDDAAGLDVEGVGMTYLEQLRQLHNAVLNRQAALTAAAADLVDGLKRLAELLIWGEKHNFDALFEWVEPGKGDNSGSYFCEKNLMDFLTSVLPNSPSRHVRIQLLQTLSMLIYNVSNERSLYYMLSNNYVNALITHPNLYTGGDVSSWSASLLKTLSGVLNATTIKFFYHEGNATFPLLEEALKFFSSSDSMKRAHVMTITLNILRLNDPSVTRYVLRHPHILTQIVLCLRRSWRRLNKHIKYASFASVGQTEAILLTQCDDVFQFLMDVMDLGIAEINEALLQRMFTTCFYPLLGSVIRGLDTDVALIEAIDVPQFPNCDFYRDTYQRLLLQTGLVGVYANNKSEIYTGATLSTGADTTATKIGSMDAPGSARGDDSVTTSAASSPRSIAEFQQLNIPAALLVNDLLPNVAYYLLVTHLASVRRDDVRRYLLLLTQCPFAPRKVLDQVARFTYSGDSVASDATDAKEDEEDAAVGRLTGVFESMSAWEQHVFGERSIQSADTANKEPPGEYVLNLLMGEFVRVALCSVPTTDSRLIMLLALQHSLQSSFMKLSPAAEAAAAFPFEQFIAVPNTSQGLHVVMQALNSAARHLSSPALRIQALNLTLVIIRHSVDIISRYCPEELASFVEEVRFHLCAAFGSLRVLIDSELEQCTFRHLSIFHDEWLRLQAGPTRRVDVLEYPHLLLDTERNPVSGRGGRTRGYSQPRARSVPVALGAAQPDSAHPASATAAVSDAEHTGINNFITQRTPIGFWLFGDRQDREMPPDAGTNGDSGRRSARDAHQSPARRNDTWQVMLEPASLFRRHVQVALLVRELLLDLAPGNLTAAASAAPRKTHASTDYSDFPLLLGQQTAINGTPITLGAHLSLESTRSFSCVMRLNADKRHRYAVCNDVLFLLVRKRSQEGLFEATCIHPLWNVDIKRMNTAARTCSVAILWYPDERSSPRAGQSYCEPLQAHSVTEFDLVFETEEDTVEYVRRYKLAVAHTTAACSAAIRRYLEDCN